MKCCCRDIYRNVFIGCQKDNIGSFSLSKLKLFEKHQFLHPILSQPINTCVLNYKHLFLILGSYEVIISAVILEDGTIIQTGQTVTSMAYKSVEKGRLFFIQIAANRTL